MKGYCKSCKKKVQGVKKSIGWSWIVFWICTLIGWIPYTFYRMFFVHKNKCPVCGLNIERGGG